jgi:hypothetical protein
LIYCIIKFDFIFEGGSRQTPGIHAGDPNDDSGSLSVILVVILPVAQMFAVLVLILLVRICYRRYCSKSKHEPQTKPGFCTDRLSPSIQVNRFWEMKIKFYRKIKQYCQCFNNSNLTILLSQKLWKAIIAINWIF